MVFLEESESVFLRNTESRDLDSICNIERLQGNVEFILPYERARHQEVIDNPNELHLTVFLKNTGELIGFVIVAGLNCKNLSLELRRIVVTKKGLGFGRQCLRILKRFCFQTLKYHRLWLDVFEDNAVAIALYKSEGFSEERLRKEIPDPNGKRRALLIFSLINLSVT